MNSKFHEFLQTRVPWRIARLYYIVPARLRRAVQWFRYRRPPKGGWGEGWRVLVFRQSPSGRRLHVLAPVKGLEFDQDLLKRHVRGEAQPDHVHQGGVSTANMAWAGHHIYVVNEEIGAQRIPMDKLIPGRFRGGVLDVGLTLIDVRTPEALHLHSRGADHVGDDDDRHAGPDFRSRGSAKDSGRPSGAH